MKYLAIVVLLIGLASAGGNPGAANAALGMAASSLGKAKAWKLIEVFG